MWWPLLRTHHTNTHTESVAHIDLIERSTTCYHSMCAWIIYQFIGFRQSNTSVAGANKIATAKKNTAPRVTFMRCLAPSAKKKQPPSRYERQAKSRDSASQPYLRTKQTHTLTHSLRERAWMINMFLHRLLNRIPPTPYNSPLERFLCVCIISHSPVPVSSSLSGIANCRAIKFKNIFVANGMDAVTQFSPHLVAQVIICLAFIYEHVWYL